MPKAKAKTVEAAPPPVAEAPAKRGAGALSKLCKPSKELAAIVGAEPLPRTAVVSKVWDHIRANNLQDPKDKRSIVADAKLQAVFGKPSATMFEMQRLLSPHLS